MHEDQQVHTIKHRQRSVEIETREAYQMKVERGWLVDGPPMARRGTVKSLCPRKRKGRVKKEGAL
jgi:hypothetical protein